MASSTTPTTSTTATGGTGASPTGEHGKRGAAFADAVAEQKLSADGPGRDKAVRTGGLVAMVVGVLGAFLAWQLSLGLDDSRDIASTQVLALAFLSVTVLGAGLYVAGSLSRVLRLWLLRQVVESQDRHDELVTALRESRSGS